MASENDYRANHVVKHCRDNDTYIVGLKKALDGRSLTGTPVVDLVASKPCTATPPTASEKTIISTNVTIDDVVFEAGKAIRFRLVGGTPGDYILTAGAPMQGGGEKYVECDLRVRGKPAA